MLTEPTYLNWRDGSKDIQNKDRFKSYFGVTDFGDLMRFAPYESGYCLLVVLSSPDIDNNTWLNRRTDHNFTSLQKHFVHILETEFKGISGIEDYTSETYTVGVGNSQINMINKVKGMSEAEISINYTEKTGTPINKYLTEYFKRVRDPYSGTTAYGASFTGSKIHETLYKSPYDVAHYKEVFNFLYIQTDSTYFNIEKALLLANAIPRNNNYSDLFNTPKGSIESKEITIPFTCSVRDGHKANILALNFMKALIYNSIDNRDGIVKLTSEDFPWTLAGTANNRTIEDEADDEHDKSYEADKRNISKENKNNDEVMEEIIRARYSAENRGDDGFVENITEEIEEPYFKHAGSESDFNTRNSNS